MPSLDSGLLDWAVRAAAPGAEVVTVRGLRDGGSPWLVRLGRRGRERSVVLRVGGDQDRPGLRTEVAALRLAAGHDLPAPRLLAADLDGDPPAVLVQRVEGSSAIPPDRPPGRLRTLGRTAARLHAVSLTPSPALPRRDRPIAGVDFAALRRRQPRPLLAEAEERVAGLGAAEADVLVHGDLWQGNALWRGDILAGLVDWACAGQGRPDLTRDVLVRRRDAFLRDALGRLDAGRG
jgi:aminoglycoside phosphotransferase (APT) family kinase protein